LSKAVLLLSETSDTSVIGPDVYVATLKRDKDALYTVSINVEDFAGRIYLQGTLAKHPASADWFNIKINDKRYIDYPINPASLRGTAGDTAIDKFNFAGNYLHIRAVIDKTAVAQPSGKVIQIVLSDEYSIELHNDVPSAIITPDAGQPAPGIGIQTFDFASVTVDSQGKIVSVKAGDPTKISAQTTIVSTYAALLELKPQVGDAAYVSSPADPNKGLYINTATGWRSVSDGSGLRRVIEFNSTATEFVTDADLPANCNVKKIVVEVDEPFDVNAAITVADSTNTLITSDELIVDSVETTVFELNKHYATANSIKVSVNPLGTTGHGKLIIDFALE